jgi:hypothetical protein
MGQGLWQIHFELYIHRKSASPGGMGETLFLCLPERIQASFAQQVEFSPSPLSGSVNGENSPVSLSRQVIRIAMLL